MKMRQDEAAIKLANNALVTDMLETLRKHVDEIEQDKWLYEDKPFF